MSQMVLDCQKELVSKLLEINPDKLLSLIIKEEAHNILDMSISEIAQVSDFTTKEELLEDRAIFWEEAIENKSPEVFNSIVSILKHKIKEMPPGFDFINKLIIEEDIH